MAQTIPFTKQALLDLPPAEAGKVYEVRDARTSGLILRVTAVGSKTFYLYKWASGAASRFKLGTFPDFTIAQAQRKADEFRGQLAAGEDPRKAGRKGMTFSELWGWWWESHGKDLRSARNRLNEYELHIKPALASRRLADITRGDVRALHAAITKAGPVSANRVVVLIRAIYNRALADEVIDLPNPAEHIRRNPEESRDRRLSASEADALMGAILATDSQQLRDYVLISLYTGQRKGNLMAMRWDQIDLKEAVWRIPRTKTGRPHVVPLLEDEVAILTRRLASASSPWVFPGKGASGHLVEPKKGWAALTKRASITDLRLHDLRRSLGSFMADTGAHLHTIGSALAHQNQATTAIYARLSLEPVKAAKAKALEAMHGGAG